MWATRLFSTRSPVSSESLYSGRLHSGFAHRNADPYNRLTVEAVGGGEAVSVMRSSLEVRPISCYRFAGGIPIDRVSVWAVARSRVIEPTRRVDGPCRMARIARVVRRRVVRRRSWPLALVMTSGAADADRLVSAPLTRGSPAPIVTVGGLLVSVYVAMRLIKPDEPDQIGRC